MNTPRCSLTNWLHLLQLALWGACSCAALWAEAQELAQEPPTEAAVGHSTSTPDAGQQPEESPKTRLLDRRPEFDVVILNSGGEVVRIETEILDLPGGEHVVPDPLPQSGDLTFRPLGEADSPYAIAWSKVREIRLWEQMVLEEAIRLTKANNFAEAFEYLLYLHAYYPRLAGLDEVTETHLVQEARSVFLEDRYAESLFILGALYGQKPDHPALASAVPVVSNKLISARWESSDYAGARRTLDQLRKTFQQVPLQNIESWNKRFAEAAGQQMQRARDALGKQDYAAARQAVRAARDILPSIAGADQLLAKIHALAPEIRVGVAQFGQPGVVAVPTLADARVAPLIRPTLVELSAADADATGPDYVFRWGTLETRDEDLQTTLHLNPAPIERGLSAEAIALRLVEMASPDSRYYQPEISTLLDYVVMGEGDSVFLHWKRPYVRPAALLQTPLRGLVGGDTSSTFWYSSERDDGQPPTMRYARPSNPAETGPRFVIERKYRDDEDAIAKLLAGEVDAIDRLPPWQQTRLRNTPEIRVGQYALPTVHVLTVNWERPILRLREFRRALCFGLDREAICRDVLLGGESAAGYQALSGPFPAGLGATDPVAYAYKQELAVRPYQPSLARALVGMAQATLQKQAEASEKSAADAGSSDEPPEDAAEPQATDAADGPTAASRSQPLVLLHGADPVARLACQSIKLYLDQIGLAITLRELEPGESAADATYDLRYLELAVWEPLIDARPLLGDGGVAGRSTAYMNLALAQLEQAANWNEATSQLKEIHEIAHYDLPLIPLWQTFNAFAYHQSLEGVGRTPISLYENLRQWNKAFADLPAP